MPFTKFTNLDFDQIKTSIKDYLRANSDFTDFDFDGSNFSVLIEFFSSFISSLFFLRLMKRFSFTEKLFVY